MDEDGGSGGADQRENGDAEPESCDEEVFFDRCAEAFAREGEDLISDQKENPEDPGGVADEGGDEAHAERGGNGAGEAGGERVGGS